MKVNFAGAITDNAAAKKRYALIKESVVKNGSTVTQRQHEKLSTQEILKRTDKEIQESYKIITKSMKSADVFIADITLPDVGVGLEIAQAMEERKPTLVLRYRKEKETPIANIKANKSKLMSYKEYDEDNLEDIIKSFLDESKDKLDTKFILIISPDIDKYLKWASEEYRQHKAQIVRDAIEDKLSKDKDYKAYLKLTS